MISAEPFHNIFPLLNTHASERVFVAGVVAVFGGLDRNVVCSVVVVIFGIIAAVVC